MPSIKFVNLSSIMAPIPIYDVMRQFAQLLDERDAAQSSNGCPGFVKRQLNVFYVQALCWWYTKTLIDPYQLGLINTKQFLDGLYTLFNSTQATAETVPLKEISREALEKAWNSMIVWDEHAIDRLDQLLVNRPFDDVIVFVSNTNPLHAAKIVSLIAEHYEPPVCAKIKAQQRGSGPTLFKTVEEGRSMDSRLLPFNAIHNVYLATSYRFCSFKATEEQRDSSTPSLMTLLIEKLAIENITVISQYEKDLTAAEENGVSPTNCYFAKEFFTANQPKQKKFN